MTESPKNYLTPEGYQKLRDELNFLLKVDRPKVVTAVNVAAAMGDRSENAEYIYGKKRLREIDRRIRFLEGRLDKVEIVSSEQIPLHVVSFGAWVQLETEDGEKQNYRLVGPDEIDIVAGHITLSSPIGRSLLGKKVGDILTIHRPKGDIEVEILKISREMSRD